MSGQTFAVSDTSPIQIYPAGRQGPRQVLNTGTVTVYLSDNNITGTGWPVAPGNALGWQDQHPLFAYVATAGTPTTILVMDVILSALENVSATVNGPIAVTSIGAPVNVQGGGEILLIGLANIDVPVGPGISWETGGIQIPAPASGLTYYGLRITVQTLGDGPCTWYLLGSGLATLAIGTLEKLPLPLAANTFGIRSAVHRFVVPMTTQYPLTLIARTPWAAGGAGQLSYTVEGISTAPAGPTTDFTNVWQDDVTGRISASANTTTTLYLPPSFQPYTVRIVSTTAAIGATHYYELQPSFGYDSVILYVNIINPPMTSGIVTEFTVPGSGRIGKLAVVANAAAAYVNINAPR